MSTAAPPEGAAAATLFIDRDLWSRHSNELVAVRTARLNLFALTSGNLSAGETAAIRCAVT